MHTFQKTLQKFFVYFFTGVSVIIVVLGINRIKKGEPIAGATPPGEQSGSSPSGSNAGSKLALKGAVQTAFTGKTYQTPWGNLAVAIQVKDGKVTAVTIPTLPDSPPSHQAKAYLIEQALRSGTANIQSVSGATITSMAFKASLESALSQSANSTSVFAISRGNTTSNNTTPNNTASIPSSLPATPKPIAVTPTSVTTQTPPKAGVSGTFTGNAYATPWGNAVASITLANGKITGVTMPVVPNSPPSVYAEPFLIQQALSAGSANIQGVSGATYASIAFKSSLESAIAKANATAGAQGQAVVTTTPAQASSAITTQTTASPSVPRSYRDDDDDEYEEWDD